MLGGVHESVPASAAGGAGDLTQQDLASQPTAGIRSVRHDYDRPDYKTGRVAWA
jgi:hypothetical protein